MIWLDAHSDLHPASQSIVPIMKELTVKQLAVISGITVRTLCPSGANAG
jgi:hypothetical protein